MNGDKNGDPARTVTGSGGETPDWTTWLRSRLERVARSERRGAEVVDDDASADTDTGSGDDTRAAAEASAVAESETSLDTDDDVATDTDTDSGADDDVSTDADSGADSDSDADAGADAGADADSRTEASRPPLPGPERGFVDSPADWLQPSLPPDASTRSTSGFGTRVLPPPPVPPPSTSSSPSAPTAEAVEQGLGSAMVAVVALSARIDALVDATTGFRTALSEHLDTSADEVLGVTRTTAADLAEHRRSHDAAITQLQGSTIENAEALHRLTERVEHLVTMAGDDEHLVDAVRPVIEANAAEQRAGGQRTEEALAAMSERLDRLEESLGQLVAGLSGLEEQLAVPGDDEPWAEAVRQVFEEVAGARRGDEERTEEALSGVPERLGGVERALDELAEDLAAVRAGPAPTALELDQSQVRAIAIAVARMLDDRPPAPPGPAFPGSDPSPEEPVEARPPTPRRRSAPLRAASSRRR